MKYVLLTILLTGCASSLKAPKIYYRPISQTLPLTATLKEIQAARPILYFASFDSRVESYRVEYITPVGKIPFLTVIKPRGGIKDTIRTAPCYVRVQAVGKGKSKWSKTIYVE